MTQKEILAELSKGNPDNCTGAKLVHTIPASTQEIIADHERRIKALEELVKALTLRSIEVKPSNIISHLPRPNNTPKIINFDSEPWLGSGRLYGTEDVRKLLAQQAELTQKETLEEFGLEEKCGEISTQEKWANPIQKYSDPKLLNKPSNDQQ